MFDLVPVELDRTDQELEGAAVARDVDPLDAVAREAAILREVVPRRVSGRP